MCRHLKSCLDQGKHRHPELESSFLARQLVADHLWVGRRPIDPLSLHVELWPRKRLKLLARRLEVRSPVEILHRGLEHFAWTSPRPPVFEGSGTVLLDMVARLRPLTVVLYRDTVLLLTETNALRDTLEQR
jgi:hypothetical protein